MTGSHRDGAPGRKDVCGPREFRHGRPMLYHRPSFSGAPYAAPRHSQMQHFPQATGLYDPRYEHDACVARLDNEPTHEVVEMGLRALENLEHRGAAGADPRTGDGAGMMVQLPDEFFRDVVDFELPPAGQYGVGVCFLPRDDTRRAKLEELIELNIRVEGQRVLGWRDVPVDTEHVGETADRTRPHMRHVFVGAGSGW